jgi:thiamine phosphate synthase YjbQ (UPF0047 family)
MKRVELTVRTGRGRGLFDLTAACERFAREAAGAGDGLLSVFVPHATAGIVVVEIGAGSDEDLLAALDRLLPRMTAGGIVTGPRATVQTTSCPCSRRHRSRSR